MTGCEVQRGLAVVVAGVVAGQIAGAGPKEDGPGSRRGFGAGEYGWLSFAVVVEFVDSVDLVDAVVAVDADPIHKQSA